MPDHPQDDNLLSWIAKTGLCDMMSFEADKFKAELERRIAAQREQDRLEARLDEQNHMAIIDECLVYDDRAYEPFGMPQSERIAQLRAELNRLQAADKTEGADHV